MTSLPAPPRCPPCTSPTSTPSDSPWTYSGKAPNPGACPSPTRRPSTSVATPPFSTPARNRRPRCSTPREAIVRRGCLTTTSPGSCASTPPPPKLDVPTSRPGSTHTCCGIHGRCISTEPACPWLCSPSGSGTPTLRPHSSTHTPTLSLLFNLRCPAPPG